MGLSTPHHKIGLSTTLLRRVCIPYKIRFVTTYSLTLKFILWSHPDLKNIIQISSIKHYNITDGSCV